MPTRLGVYISKLRNLTITSSTSLGHNEINVPGESTEACLIESPRYHDSPRGLHASRRFHVPMSASSSISEEARMKSWVSDNTHLEHVVDVVGFVGTHRVDSEIDSHLEDTSRSAWNPKANDLPDGSVAVTEYSSDPCQDFLMSMLAMVDSRMEQNLTVDWNYLEELAMCFLDLNVSKYHYHILSAYFDLLMILHRSRVLS
ncbi:hypothetical protein L6164_015873 [Bauhinia variegata]|uniref:Uncharacterized protein n=1 Tax=Bauhinia variegata TaxID=167791 RepID=A0ACB9NN03_BAUVA|nr:hypothetical protein L6164_015873 [Bauhinia variegata]